ncbi:MAG: PGF-pre-PGF domain-containing protein, partial [Nanoarchaeota archaeon]|nr:PGF-pre-PGF domain-containing protein [Nanoarchaeota archaeon]
PLTGVRLVSCWPYEEVYRIDEIKKGEKFSSFEDRYCTDLHFYELEVLNNLSNIKISIKESNKTISPEGIIYNVYDVTAENLKDEDIKEVTFRYRVPVSWIEENGINDEKVTLQRQADILTWETLDSKQIGKDDNYYYYGASSDKFSYYAIVGQKVSIWDVVEAIDKYYAEQIEFEKVLSLISRYYIAINKV